VISEVDYPSGLSWDEFLALPHETRNAALVDGEVVVNPPNALHELVVQNLVILFREWLRGAPDRGDVSTQQPVQINDRRGYQPDFAWYPPQHCAPPGEPPAFSGLPGLIVEVFSPSTRRFDVMRKRSDYEHIGIPEAWFVDPIERQLLVCQRAEPEAPFDDVEMSADEILTSPLLDGFRLHVGALFER
jgi:Uma2 family endonuclease